MINPFQFYDGNVRLTARRNNNTDVNSVQERLIMRSKNDQEKETVCTQGC